MAKKTSKTTEEKVVKKKVATKDTVKKVEGVKKIFLDKKSAFLLTRGEYPKSKVEKNPDLYFDTIADAQSQAMHYLEEIKDTLKRDEYTEIYYRIKSFS